MRRFLDSRLRRFFLFRGLTTSALLAFAACTAAAQANPPATSAQSAQASAAQQSSTQTSSQKNEHGTGIVPKGVQLVSQMPAPQPERPFHFPAAQTQTLANGLRVFVIPDHRQPSVAILLVLMSAGTTHDPAGLPGVASLTASMLTQGTATRSAQQFAQAIDFVGGAISANAGDDETSATAVVLSRDADLGLNLLSGAVLHPAFSDAELSRQRQQLLSGLRVEYSDAGYLASAVFDRAVFGSSSYGLPTEGTPDTASKITRDDLTKFHDANYAPNEALLAFAGDITPERAFALAEKYFGSWQKKEAPEPNVAAPAPAEGLHFIIVDKPDAVQTQIRAGNLGIRRNDPDYIPLLVTNRIFGGGYNSRLNTEVRVKKGLTYGATSSFDASRFAGEFVADTYTRTEATVETTKLVINLIGQMSTGEIQPSEVKFAQDYLAGVYPIQSETAAEVAQRVLTVAEYGLPEDYNQTYRQRIDDVTQAEVSKMATRYFSAQNLDVVLVGNSAKFLPELKTAYPHAQFEEIPLADLDLLTPDLRQPKAAAPAASPEALAKGQQIVLDAAKASGGDAIGSVQTVTLTEQGNVYAPQGTVPINVKFDIAYPDKVHATVSLGGAQIEQVFDGKSAWVKAPQGTIEVPASANGEFERQIALFAGWGLYQQAFAGKVQAADAGQEQFDGKPADAVNWLAPFGEVKLYFDASTHFLVGAKYKAAAMQGGAETEEHFSDFRAVEGKQVPYHTVTYRSGTKFAEDTVQEIHVNPSLDPSLFAKPGSAPAPKP